MIAKGLHFPAVTLVGVVIADLGLNAPDYQAGERTFQVLCQVAGRAGRGREAGDVVVQTYQPDNYAIKAAATQDYDPLLPPGDRLPQRAGEPPSKPADTAGLLPHQPGSHGGRGNEMGRAAEA